MSTILIFFIGIFIWISQEISVPSIKSRFLLLFDAGKTKISVTKPDSVKEAVEKSDILTLRIQSIHDTWIKVTTDEKMVYEGTLLKGTEQEWKGKEKFYLSIGYVPGIKASLNGNPIDISVGAKKDINALEITKDSLNSLKFSETNR
ncbi:MAG: DUF4115 domain-containing protein [Elusimicrobia bacterium]|nr:DUF4115 domain-containing protein [Elusimicrobiota bacterium]